MSDDSGVSTVLVPERQSLFAWLGCSALFHLGAGLSVWGITAATAVFGMLVPMCRPEPPKITDTIEVSVVSLPKSQLNVPDRAQRVKRAAGEVVAPEPPPVKQSDLKFETDKPKPQTGNADAAARQRAIEEMERQKLLEDLLNAPEGAVDRNATDPHGDADAAALAALGVSAKGDPEMQRWAAQVQQILLQHFKPLAAVTQANPDARCLVRIQLDPDSGAILGYEVTGPSGILSFDQSAERAVQDVSALPPPPEKYREYVRQEGVEFRFSPPKG